MTGPEPPIRVLFLGCGAATAVHSRTLRRIGGVELFYASRDPKRAESYRQRCGGRYAYDSYESGLEDGRVDVAFVATPTATHRDLVMRALEPEGT